jgi:hypothetical protein
MQQRAGEGLKPCCVVLCRLLRECGVCTAPQEGAALTRACTDSSWQLFPLCMQPCAMCHVPCVERALPARLDLLSYLQRMSMVSCISKLCFTCTRTPICAVWTGHPAADTTVSTEGFTGSGGCGQCRCYGWEQCCVFATWFSAPPDCNGCFASLSLYWKTLTCALLAMRLSHAVC